MSAPEIAIVGAGLCGLSCARALQDAGRTVRLFDKARKAGGRMSTRRGPGLSFDHGAQYFTARERVFEAEVERWRDAGAAGPWSGRIGVAEGGEVRAAERGPERWVGVPTMSAIPRLLASEVDVVAGTRVGSVRPVGEGEGWRVHDHEGAALGTFAAVLLTVPAAQAVPLLEAAPALRERVAGVRMEPCWAVMVSLRERWPIEADGMFVNGSPLSWAARDGSKPDRRGETWVLHATPAWTHEHWDDEREGVVEALLRALTDATGQPAPAVEHADVQRWRYARADDPLPERFLWDPRARLGVGGDWCGGPRVEGAWLSGRALASAVLEGDRASGAGGGGG